MKKTIFSIVLVLISTLSFSDYFITRGPSVGEIYLIGPTYTGLALYRSIDNGQSIICIDSINASNMMAITADKTQGIIYYTTMQGSLYFSDNYGMPSSWMLRHSGISAPLCNSENIGFVFEHAAAHSEDFGYTFISHTGNGAFGLFKEAENGFSDDGYFLSYKDEVQDSLYLFVTMDNFNNLELINVLNFQWNNQIELTRGNNFGEIYLCNLSSNMIYYSADFGSNFINTNHLNLELDYSKEIVGGRQSGELYLMCNFVSLAWQNANIYIFYSTDFGITFELYHPFAKGQEPLLSNFSAKTFENHNSSIFGYDSVYYVYGVLPLNVQFYNYSIGDINDYEWDFNNDGIVDSYEVNPMFTYNEYGWHSVKLTIYDDLDTNIFIRENYIYVDKINSMGENSKVTDNISCYPNPFTDIINFTISNHLICERNELLIFDLKGKIVNQISCTINEAIWDGKNMNGEKCKPGIYLVKHNEQKVSKKILLTY